MEDLNRQIDVLEKKAAGGRSPFFAQLAAYYLESGQAQVAVRTCEDGLANYPFYATGHLIRGKALMALKMNAEARREFTWVVDFMPGNAAARKLLESVPPGEDETFITPAIPPAFEAKEEPAPAYTPAAEPSFELPNVEPSQDFGLPAEAPAAMDFNLPSEAPANDFGISAEPPPSTGFDLPTEAPTTNYAMEPEQPAPAPEFSGFSGFAEPPAAVEAPAMDVPAEPEIQSQAPDFGGFGGFSSPGCRWAGTRSGPIWAVR